MLLQGTSELKESQKKTDSQLQKTDVQLQETDELLEKTIKKLDEIGRQLGDLGLVQGEVAEDFYLNSRKSFQNTAIAGFSVGSGLGL